MLCHSHRKKHKIKKNKNKEEIIIKNKKTGVGYKKILPISLCFFQADNIKNNIK